MLSKKVQLYSELQCMPSRALHLYLLWDSNLQPHIPKYYTLYKFKHYDQYTTNTLLG